VLTDEDVILSAREAAAAYLEQDPDLEAADGLREAVRMIEDSERAAYLDKG
jgi:ATP-dependent DNA helicase RecG